jgi:hypothetical protein
MVIRPDATVFADMISKVGTILSYDGGDTGELPNFFTLLVQYRQSTRILTNI